MHVLHPLDLPGTPTIFEEHSVGAEAWGLLSKDEGDSDYEVVRHFRDRVERRPHQHTRRGKRNPRLYAKPLWAALCEKCGAASDKAGGSVTLRPGKRANQIVSLFDLHVGC